MWKDEKLYRSNYGNPVSLIDDRRPPEISELSVVLDQTIRDLEAARTEAAAQWVPKTVQTDREGTPTAGGGEESGLDEVEKHSSKGAREEPAWFQ